jgi:hypothetical protein
MTKLEGVQFSVNKEELSKSQTDASQDEIKTNRPKQRLVKLIEDTANNGDDGVEGVSDHQPRVELRFLLLPEKINVT